MNKKTVNLLVWAVWIAFIALIIQVVDQMIGTETFIGTTGTWIAFQAFAIYFLGGCIPKGGAKAFAAYVCGIITGIVIFELAGALSFLGVFWCVPVAIFIPVIVVMLFEKIPLLDYIPAVFIGCGAFFAIMNYVPDATYIGTAAYELSFCLIGLLFGWIAIVGKGIIDKVIKVESIEIKEENGNIDQDLKEDSEPLI